MKVRIFPQVDPDAPYKYSEEIMRDGILVDVDKDNVSIDWKHEVDLSGLIFDGSAPSPIKLTDVANARKDVAKHVLDLLKGDPTVAIIRVVSYCNSLIEE